MNSHFMIPQPSVDLKKIVVFKGRAAIRLIKNSKLTTKKPTT
jgi:hypothetical protein